MTVVSLLFIKKPDTNDMMTNIDNQEKSDALPSGIDILCYLNPFNSSTLIQYELLEASEVEIDIHNVLGRKVENLLCEYQKAGCYRVIWNAKDRPSGIHYYKIQTGRYSESKKMVLMK